MNWILCEDPGTPRWCLQPTEKCIQTRKHKYSFTIKIYSWQCNHPEKRLLFYGLENSAKTTDTPMSGLAVKSHGWPKKGRQLYAKRTTSYLLLSQGYPPVLGAIRRQQRHRRICLPQVQLESEVTDYLQETGADHPQKTKNKNKKSDGRRDIRTTVCEIFLNGWRSSLIIWRTQNCMHPRTQILYSLPERPKLRSLQENQDY